MILRFFQALTSPEEIKYSIYYFVRGILQCCFIDKGKEKADSDTKRNGTADGPPSIFQRMLLRSNLRNNLHTFAYGCKYRAFGLKRQRQ